MPFPLLIVVNGMMDSHGGPRHPPNAVGFSRMDMGFPQLASESFDADRGLDWNIDSTASTKRCRMR